MRTTPSARGFALQQLRQLACCFYPSHCSFPVNRASEQPCALFSAQFAKDSRQLFHVGVVHQPARSQRLPAIHPHIQPRILHETESALSNIELRTAHTQIQQHPVTRSRFDRFRHLIEVRPTKLKPPCKRGQPSRSGLNRCVVAIETMKPSGRRARFQYGFRVSTPSGRAIDVTPARFGTERRQYLRLQDRLVDAICHVA